MNEGITQPQGESLHHTFGGYPLDVQVVFVLPVFARLIGFGAEDTERVGAESINSGEVISRAEQKRAFALAIEILNLRREAGKAQELVFASDRNKAYSDMTFTMLLR